MSADEPPINLSIVTTLYDSERHVEEFVRRAAGAAAAYDPSYEIVFVNDGSPDRAVDIVIRLSQADPRIRVIDLSRNFGHHKAMLTGLAHARGALVWLIDSDLEEAPEWLAMFHETMQRERADVVYGVQGRRKGGMLERVAGAVFYSTFNVLLDQPLPRNVVTARLMTARYVSQLVRHRDREVCIAALWMITGFRQVPLVVDKQHRSGSAYRVGHRVAVMVNAITSFSNRPLVYIFYLGCAIMAISVVAAIELFRRVLLGEIGVAGWPSLIISVWFLGGVTTFCLGVIGMYLSKVFTETKDRPYTVVRAYYPEGMERQHE